MTVANLLAIAAIVFAAFVARGVTGFGSATLAVPMLAQVISLRTAVPLLLMLDFASSVVLVRVDKTKIDRSEVVSMLPFAMCGVALGVTLLVRLPVTWLLASLGVVVIAFGLRALGSSQSQRRVSRAWVVPAGLAGGTLGGLFGSGAATPFMIYLTHRLRDRTRVRATFSAFALFDYGFRLVVFALGGLLLPALSIETAGIGFPAMAAGLFVGNRMHGRISDAMATKAIAFLLVLAGILLLAKASTLTT
ncbi:MAG TPA: sulfite exporter TauE/SafE family protein [Casimicrobiaceae bacterium]|nr:sulfite exporter TauE/SafE family protein [Casimicrobiaceae bacterium]